MEEKRTIKGFENYTITKTGVVINEKRNLIMKYQKSGKREYLRLSKNGKKYDFNKQQLILLGFPEIEIVGHKEKNKKRKNKFVIDEKNSNITKAFYTNDDYFIIDTNKIELIKEYYWYENDKGYIKATVKPKKYVYLHKFLTNYKIVDHKNGDKKDNRIQNLRECTTQENNQNRKNFCKNKSGIIGVVKSHYLKKEKCWKWRATIKINYKHITLMSSKNIEECIISRLKAEKEYFKDFAPQQHLFEKYNI